MSPAPYSRIDEVRRRLETFAALCEKASLAAVDEDVEALFEISFAARQLRHAISTSSDLSYTSTDGKDIERLADSLEASHRAAPGDELLRNFHERPLPGDEALLCDPMGVLSLVEALLPTTWDFKEDLVILFGNGLDAPADILGRIGQSRICVYLPEGVEPREYSDDVAIIHSESDLYRLLASWAPRPPGRIVSRSLPGGEVSTEEQNELIQAAELYLGYVRVDRNTTSMFADTWLSQGITNLAKTINIPSVATFADAFAGKPMIIVAPGPSLSKNIAQLHKMKGKVILCTFSHTLSAFAAEGIDPDIVVTVDSNALQYHFKDFPMERAVAMINGVTVNPSLYDMPAPRHITMGANGGFDKWIGDLLGENLIVPAGGSVATTSMALGIKWKCDPILVMGLDLSFTNGQYYVNTSCDGDLKVSTSEDGSHLVMDGWSDDCWDMRRNSGSPITPDIFKTFTLKGYYGGEVQTTQMFWLFHDWFEKKAAEVGDSVRLINCTEGGCYIEGMEHIPLQEAYETYIEPMPIFSVAKIMDERIASIPEARRSNAIAGIETLVTDIERCLSLVGRCTRMAERVRRQPSRLDALAALESDLVRALKTTRFMSGSKQREIAIAYERASAAEKLSELLDASQDLYREIRKAATQVLPGLREVLRGVRCQV